ncbi:MAG: hypothetical protein NE334_20510 [Lentisphaeraceae bacterium]|nr:hypothetical protein [Lentisphaeraceae bacterium]
MKKVILSFFTSFILSSCSTTPTVDELIEQGKFDKARKIIEERLVEDPFDTESVERLIRLNKIDAPERIIDSMRWYYSTERTLKVEAEYEKEHGYDYPWIKSEGVLWRWLPLKEFQLLKQKLKSGEITKEEFTKKTDGNISRDIDWKIFHEYRLKYFPEVQ